jgi:hypothetical protein
MLLVLHKAIRKYFFKQGTGMYAKEIEEQIISVETKFASLATNNTVYSCKS